MSIKTQIIGGLDNRVAELHEHEGEVGLLVYTEPHRTGELSGVPFTNPTFGANLNQNVTFSGTPELITNGGDGAGWTGSIVTGVWDFTAAGIGVAGSAAVSITGANNLDTAFFIDATEIDMSGYTAITGQVNLIAFNGASNDIIIQMRNNGVDVGVSVNVNNYITTSILGSYQGIVIPKSDLEIDDLIVDEMRITILRSGGAKPTIYFDNMQIEEVGNPLAYIVEAAEGEIFTVKQVIFTLADVGTGAQAYSYKKLGAITTLANGITFTATVSGKTVFASTIKQLGDFLDAVGVISNFIDDGVETFYTIKIDVTTLATIPLDSRRGDDFLIVVNDDLSGLEVLRAVALGSKEIIADR